MAQRIEASWVELDPTTLPGTAKIAYDNYKAAYKAMKAARETFETDMAILADVPTGKRMVFGYNFGKLSVAIVDDDRKPTKPKSSIASLAQFMAQAQANGHAT